MAKSRREFLTDTSLGLLGAVVAAPAALAQNPAELPPGAPPTFGASPAVGPEVSVATFTEAEKLVQIEMTSPDLSQAASSWRTNLAAVYERRTGPRKVAIEAAVAPWSQWNPVLPGQKAGPEHDRFVRSPSDAGALAAKDEDIAFAPVSQLSRWIEEKKLSSERLTNIYLERLVRFDPKLRCTITPTPELAQSARPV